MAQLGLNIHLMSHILNEHAPDLASHFLAQGLEYTSFISSWFLTLFTTTFSIPCCARILDCLLLDGPCIVFKVALTIILAEQEKLLEMDMEEMLTYLNKEAPKLYEQDPSLLIQNSEKKEINLNDRKYRKLEKEYFEKKSREARELAEMRRLRDENVLYKERIEALEKENANLTRKVATGRWTLAVSQKKEATLKDENYRLKNNLEKYKRIESNANSRRSSLKHLIEGESGAGSNFRTSKNEGEIKPACCSKLTGSLSTDPFVLQLQEELVASRLREACLDETVTELEAKLEKSETLVQELNTNKQLLNSQQEIVKIKVRFAEIQSAYQELQTRLHKIEQTDANFGSSGLNFTGRSGNNSLRKQRSANSSTSSLGETLLSVASKKDSFKMKGRNMSVAIIEEVNKPLSSHLSHVTHSLGSILNPAAIGMVNEDCISLTRESQLEKELKQVRIEEAKRVVENKDQAMKIIELQQWCDHLNSQINRKSKDNTDLKIGSWKKLNCKKKLGIEVSPALTTVKS